MYLTVCQFGAVDTVQDVGFDQFGPVRMDDSEEFLTGLFDAAFWRMRPDIYEIGILVACALYEDAPLRDAGGPALSAAEERLLFERVEEIHGICLALQEKMPGSRVSMLGAMVFVERAIRNRQTGGGG